MRELKLGDKISAIIEEVLPESALIVSVDGTLYRVMNDTGIRFKQSDKLQMTVTAMNPVLFRLQKQEEKKLDRFV